PGLNDDLTDTRDCKQQTDLLRAPTVAIAHVQHRGRGQRDVREVAQEADAREAPQVAIRTQQLERADRIRLAPGEWTSPLGRKRFGQHEESVERIRKAEACSHPER